MRDRIVLLAVMLLVVAACQRKDDAPTQSDVKAPAPVTPGLTAATPPAAAPAGPSLGQASDTKSELRMEVTEAARAGGVLTVKTRFTLVGGKPGSRPLPGSSGSDVYLTAGDKKYLLLKDDHDKELMSNAYYPDFAQIGATQTWWGKFPAPSADTKAVDFYFSGFEPVENVAITDR